VKLAPLSAETSELYAYQQEIRKLLADACPECPVHTEWAAMTDEAGIYSPRLDVAVGPFATHDIFADTYDDLCGEHVQFLEYLHAAHSENVEAFGLRPNHLSLTDTVAKNWNARCWLAIEIENMVSHKHLMGGAINAAALGRIGLAVAWREINLKRFVRMREYLLFLASVGKNTFDPSNLLILSADQLMEALHAYLATDA
jgi:hypothetical protein